MRSRLKSLPQIKALWEHFRECGFRVLHDVEGGIDAWSREVDASVPRCQGCPDS